MKVEYILNKFNDFALSVRIFKIPIKSRLKAQ